MPAAGAGGARGGGGGGGGGGGRGRAAAAGVAVTGEEALQALGAEAARVGGAGVALEEGERDRRGDVAEDAGGAGPEGVELRAELVGECDARLHEGLASAGPPPPPLPLLP